MKVEESGGISCFEVEGRRGEQIRARPRMEVEARTSAGTERRVDEKMDRGVRKNRRGGGGARKIEGGKNG